MISHREKRAALELTQQDIDRAAKLTAVALTMEPTGLYTLAVTERLAEAMAATVFSTELPEREEWASSALEDFWADMGEASYEDALDAIERRDAA